MPSIPDNSQNPQALLDAFDRASAHEGIRQALEQEERGEEQDIEEFFAEFEKSRGITRELPRDLQG